MITIITSVSFLARIFLPFSLALPVLVLSQFFSPFPLSIGFGSVTFFCFFSNLLFLLTRTEKINDNYTAVASH